MKRIVYCILTVLLGLGCLTACNKGGENSSSSEQTSTKETNNLHITTNEVTLSVGESVQLEATVDMENVFIFWSVRDENIATVTTGGLLTAVAEGETICYATFAGETSMCLVKVLGETAKPLLSVNSQYADGIKLLVGDSFDPSIVVKLGDSIVNDAAIEYSVSDASVAGVEDGEIIAKGVGDATVSVKVTYGEETVSLSLPVSVVTLA